MNTPSTAETRGPDSRPDRVRQLASLAGWILLCMAAGAIGALATSTAVRDWYPGLAKPPGNPPSWVFGPVWTVLYVLMGIAGWRFARHQSAGRRLGLICFGVQLTLNSVWSLLFFGLRMPLVAMVDIVVLWLVIGVTLRLFWQVDRVAGGLLIPYLAWVTFAIWLNAGIVYLN